MQIQVRLDVPKLYIPEYRSAIWAGKLKPSLTGFSRHLLEQYNQRMYADVEIHSRDGEVFFAHRVVLAGESAYLSEQFEYMEQDHDNTVDGGLMKVTLPDVNYRTLEAVLRLMYGFELNLDYNTLFEVRPGFMCPLWALVCAGGVQLRPLSVRCGEGFYMQFGPSG